MCYVSQHVIHMNVQYFIIALGGWTPLCSAIASIGDLFKHAHIVKDTQTLFTVFFLSMQTGHWGREVEAILSERVGVGGRRLWQSIV